MKRATGILLIVAGVFIIPAGCARQPMGEFGGPMVLRRVLNTAELDYYWHVKVELFKRETLTELHLVDDRLYAMTSRNRLLSLDAPRGMWDWTAEVARPSQPMHAPRHADGVLLPRLKERLTGENQPASDVKHNVVMLNTLMDLVIYDRLSGKELAKIPLPSPSSTTGATDGKYFYFGSIRHWYHAMNISEGLIAWELPTNAYINAPLELFDGVVYVAGTDGIFYASQSGQSPGRLWNSSQPMSLAMHGPVTAGFHVDQRGAFVPCEDNSLYAYSRTTGEPLWEPFICQGPLRNQLQAGRDTLFLFATGDRFYAIDVATGQARWSLPDGRTVLGVGKRDKRSLVYVLDKDNNLMVVDEINGRVIKEVPLTGYDVFVANSNAPVIYAASKDGHIVCIRSVGAGRLTSADLTR